MPTIGVEAGAASAIAGAAAALVSAYLADWLGLTLAPFAILPLALVFAAVVFVWLRRRAAADPAALAAFTAIVSATFAWLMWRARPDFLPTGSGSDLAHHLALLAYLEQHGRLVHDATVGAYLGEMIDYTPGAHLLMVMIAACLRTTAMHVAHPVVALTVAVKSGTVFLIARRLIADESLRVPCAIVAALLPWLPYVFFAGSFMEQSFLSQVVSELFAVAMWWTVVAWGDHASAAMMALFASFGAAAFLTWPVWLGPLVLMLVAVVSSTGTIPWRARLRHLAIAIGPIAIVAALYAASRQVYGFHMVNAVGFAVWPSPRTLGWTFIAAAAAGITWSTIDRRARSAAWLFAAIVLQAAALIAFGRSSGASAPYLSLKMAYLAIYPLSVGAAVALAAASRRLMPPRAAATYAWVAVALVTLGVGRSVASVPAPTPVVTAPVAQAGAWARTHLPPACVDYLVADGYTGYWLHLAVLGNPRAAGRSLRDDTFDPHQAIVRWILPGGLPYAIAGDFDALPRDIRTNVDVLARFGPAAVVQRRGPAACADKP
jgi:hypothetical protein